MKTVQVMSCTTIKASSEKNANSPHRMDLTPWDLQFLTYEGIQKGLLFRIEQHSPNRIQHLQHSLSTTLAFFPPLAGRLKILQHDHNTASSSSHIVCNNLGVLFVHAIAHDTNVTDILNSKYVPPIVRSFFALNGVKNFQGTSQPLLAVQVTELVHGIFIAFTFNHVVADGKSFWHFVNSWAEISRGSPQISQLPTLQRCFLHGVDLPIRFPFTEEEEVNQHSQNPKPQTLPERFFHFTKEKITQLKSKANQEANTQKISSLQALLTHLWRSAVRCQKLKLHEEVTYVLLVGVRPRMVPPLADGYFGNAVLIDSVAMKASELLQGGIGKGAWEMNKLISLHTNEKIKQHYESWVRTPKQFKMGTITGAYSLTTSSSPRFNIYGNDFGWGKPVAVRSGGANKTNQKITVFAGAEEGSIDIEMYLPYETLEAMGNDPEFMDVVSS